LEARAGVSTAIHLGDSSSRHGEAEQRRGENEESEERSGQPGKSQGSSG
jgi:hypothetical protein